MKYEASFYFSHDVRARSDIKIRAIVAEFGIAGYGAWWVIVENLRDSVGYKIPDAPWARKAIAADLPGLENVDRFFEALLETGLIISEDRFLFSPSLIRRMGKLDGIREKRVAAGEASAAARSGKAKKTTDTQEPIEEETPKEAPTDSQEAPVEPQDDEKPQWRPTAEIEAERSEALVSSIVAAMALKYPVKTQNILNLEAAVRYAVKRQGLTAEMLRVGLDSYIRDYVPFTPTEYLQAPENWISKTRWLENWRDLGKTQRNRSRNGGGYGEKGSSGIGNPVGGGAVSPLALQMQNRNG